MLDFIRISCAVPAVKVGDPRKNTQDICDYMAKADGISTDVLVFPELAITGYTCADLFFQDTLLKQAREGLCRIVEYSLQCPELTTVVGMPLPIDGKLYNCAAVVSSGKIRGIIPKRFIPNYNEFYEQRSFASGADIKRKDIASCELGVPGDYRISVDALFRLGDSAVLGVEICEDLWSPLPPSVSLALKGAEVIVNLSASNETVGKRAYRRELVKHQSSVCNCVYAYCSAGYTESTQDLVFSGHSVIAENGIIRAENKNQLDSDYMLTFDADLGRVRSDRRKNTSFRDAASTFGNPAEEPVVNCGLEALRSDGTLRTVNKLPFVPSQKSNRFERCMSIFNMQVAGLKQRLSTIGANAVIGVSGGLDSTLALLVAAEAMRQLGRPASDVYGVTMPCFGTSDRTYQNALELMRTLGISSKEINIKNAVTGHFGDIGHDPSVHNGTYENSQARERTQILMDYASVVGGIVVGTGDLSELALGWCTYNDDHMSMYGVNASIPKTLIRWMIEAISEAPAFAASREVLLDVLDTPISPELLPPDEKGNISQHTEDLVGPYALHDFFLYYLLRFGFSPAKIYTLACRAFAEDFDPQTIKKWMKTFYRRFFTQQFKRSCMPDGVKVGSVCLSPRGDWRMPSDANGRIWLDEIETVDLPQ